MELPPAEAVPPLSCAPSLATTRHDMEHLVFSLKFIITRCRSCLEWESDGMLVFLQDKKKFLNVPVFIQHFYQGKIFVNEPVGSFHVL